MNAIFAERIYGVPWIVLAGAAAVIAIVYAVLPADIAAEGWRWLVLRWCHTLAWTFLALAALARSKATRVPVDLTAPLAAVGGLIYVVFMLVTLYGGGSA